MWCAVDSFMCHMYKGFLDFNVKQAIINIFHEITPNFKYSQ